MYEGCAPHKCWNFFTFAAIKIATVGAVNWKDVRAHQAQPKADAKAKALAGKTLDVADSEASSESEGDDGFESLEHVELHMPSCALSDAE